MSPKARGPASGGARGDTFRWASAFYLVLAVVGVVWLGLRGGRIESGIFIGFETWPVDLVLGIVTGLLLSGGWEVAGRFFPQPRSVEAYFREVLGPLDVSEALVLALLSAIAEEIFFRGALQGSFGLLPAAILFTLLHMGPGRDFRVWTIFAGVAGVALGGLTLWREALLAPMTAHALVNAIGLYRLGRRENGTESDLSREDREQAIERFNRGWYTRRPVKDLYKGYQAMTDSTQQALDRIDSEKESYLEELKDYLRIPSISTDPAYSDDVRRCAEFLKGQMEAAGLEAELIETDRNPLVYGEWSGAEGQPTLLFYGHYDVQPPDPLDEWRNPPFEPTVEGDHLVARGATDDKGQSYAHLKAVAAVLAETGRLPVNVKFLVEGEEESGGESIDHYVKQDRGDRLACDAVIVSDSSMYAPGTPSLLYGLKGLAYMEISVQGPSQDLHSGSFGGGVANPANALSHIISALVDPRTGRIQIPGFYDDVLPLEQWERDGFSSLPYDEANYCRDIGISETFGEEGYTTLERVWARPTCDVNGLYSGYQGEGAKTVLPARAGAKVSMRLVPNQDPAKVAGLFKEYVKEITPAGVTVDVEYIHGAEAVLVDAKGPISDAAMKALEEVWGNSPVLVREGGSIPIVATFAQVLEVPVLLMGFGLSDDALHSPNEKFNISHFYNGIRTTVRLLEHVSEIG